LGESKAREKTRPTGMRGGERARIKGRIAGAFEEQKVSDLGRATKKWGSQKEDQKAPRK